MPPKKPTDGDPEPEPVPPVPPMPKKPGQETKPGPVGAKTPETKGTDDLSTDEGFIKFLEDSAKIADNYSPKEVQKLRDRAQRIREKVEGKKKTTTEPTLGTTNPPTNPTPTNNPEKKPTEPDGLSEMSNGFVLAQYKSLRRNPTIEGAAQIKKYRDELIKRGITPPTQLELKNETAIDNTAAISDLTRQRNDLFAHPEGIEPEEFSRRIQSIDRRIRELGEYDPVKGSPVPKNAVKYGARVEAAENGQPEQAEETQPEVPLHRLSDTDLWGQYIHALSNDPNPDAPETRRVRVELDKRGLRQQPKPYSQQPIQPLPPQPVSDGETSASKSNKTASFWDVMRRNREDRKNRRK